MKTETYILPAYWASYLINGEVCLDDFAIIDEWFDNHQNLGDALTCSDEEFFTYYHDAPGVGGCMCLEYVFPVIKTP